ncbi:Pleckstrin homology domain-containing protein [Amylocarpus encephaloides]|uniref:Pleckstrin homology domain-containing protein n=1 Tax=Amylocarpus encephaloides TaxID=45428 RepID=A0A9P8C7U5_9HELO|nr:Pleckstrin homology domain-containing protein [Amylocarpus encephaloides]
MSEAPKTVEEPVVAPTTTTAPAVAEPAPAAATPAVEPAVVEPAAETTETPAVAAPVVEEETAPVKEDVKPVEEGVLGYKGPGLLKGLIFQKKFFFFGTDAVENKALSSYLRGEKEATAANHNVAWASHTGNGLLFFSKKTTDKAAPAGLFNLSEVSDLIKEGVAEFQFVSGGHKHTFQSTSAAERDNWVSVLTTKIEEAKALVDTVKETEEYKKSLTALTPKPVVAPVVAAKKVEEPKKEEATPAVEDPKEEKKEEIKEEKKSRKSRSASRKRTSIFGGFGQKKEEKVEAKEEAVTPTATEEPVVAAEAPAVVEPVVEDPATATETAKPTPTKRNSIFGTLKSQFSQKDKKATEAPVVPAKDTETATEPVSETAPVIPQVEATEPLATTEATPEVAPVEAAPVTNGETKVAETPVTKAEKRKSSLPWLSSKKEKPTSDSEDGEKEKPKSPFAKLRATVKGKTSPKAEKEKAPETKTEEATTEAAPATTAAPVVEEPVVSTPTPAVATTTPQVTASA